MPEDVTDENPQDLANLTTENPMSRMALLLASEMLLAATTSASTTTQQWPLGWDNLTELESESQLSKITLLWMVCEAEAADLRGSKGRYSWR